MKTIYFDNAATTKPAESAIRAADHAMNEMWANPSSIYSAGNEAAKALAAARRFSGKIFRGAQQNLFSRTRIKRALISLYMKQGFVGQALYPANCVPCVNFWKTVVRGGKLWYSVS